MTRTWNDIEELDRFREGFSGQISVKDTDRLFKLIYDLRDAGISALKCRCKEDYGGLCKHCSGALGSAILETQRKPNESA